MLFAFCFFDRYDADNLARLMHYLEVRLYGSPRLNAGEYHSFRVDRFARLAIIHKDGGNNGNVVFRGDGHVEFRHDTAHAEEPGHVSGRMEFVDDLDAVITDESERRLRVFRLWTGGAMRVTPRGETDSINCGGHRYRYAEVVYAEE